MNETSHRGDELVAEYLERVRAAAAGLDPGRRQELIEDLSEHIAAARSELAPETEAGVRTVLERLGDPAVIAAEASADRAPTTPPVAAPPAPAPPAPAPPPSAPPPSAPPPSAPPPSEPRSHRTLVAVLITVFAVILLAPIVVCVLGLGLFAASPDGAGTAPGPVISVVPAPTARPS